MRSLEQEILTFHWNNYFSEDSGDSKELKRNKTSDPEISFQSLYSKARAADASYTLELRQGELRKMWVPNLHLIDSNLTELGAGWHEDILKVLNSNV